MCGIYGIVQLDGVPADTALMSAMGRVIVHRGPDDEGHHVDGTCAIGMRRLSIIDLAGGHQPIRTADGRLAIVCNGEIYNYRELRAELISAGRVFARKEEALTVIVTTTPVKLLASPGPQALAVRPGPKNKGRK